MKLVKRSLLLLGALAFAVGLIGCDMEKSDMSPDTSTFLEQLGH